MFETILMLIILVISGSMVSIAIKNLTIKDDE